MATFRNLSSAEMSELAAPLCSSALFERYEEVIEVEAANDNSYDNRANDVCLALADVSAQTVRSLAAELDCLLCNHDYRQLAHQFAERLRREERGRRRKCT